MIEYDKEFYKNVEGKRVFSHVIRPSVHNNNIGPLPINAVTKINITKNGLRVVLMEYTIIQPIPEGKVLKASATFELREESAAFVCAPMDDYLVCQDTPIEEKVGDDFKLAYIERPRNQRKNGLGPFAVGDVIRVEFILNHESTGFQDVVVDFFEYTPTSPISEGNVLVGLGTVDFCECN
jgi:hypothetical protein